MKLVLLMLVVIFGLSSCGNPHLTKKNVVDRFTPGAEGEDDPTDPTDPENPPVDPPTSTPVVFDWYIGSAADARNGRVTTGFWGVTNVNNQGYFIEEDFETFAPSNTYLGVNNQAFYTHSYVLEHRVAALPVSRTVDEISEFVSDTNYVFAIERPLEQDGLTSAGAGLDSLTQNSQTADALLWTFKDPVEFFGLDSLDFESTNAKSAYMRLFDCNKKRLYTKQIIYPGQDTGDRELHFVGFKASSPVVCYVLITVGDYNPTNTGYRAIGIESFYYGVYQE